jgi:hypothetical protein
MKAVVILAGLVLVIIIGVVLYWSYRTPSQFNNGVSDLIEKPNSRVQSIKIQDPQLTHSNSATGSNSGYYK